MAGRLVDLGLNLLERNDGRPGLRPGLRVVDRDLVVDGIRSHTGEALNLHLVERFTRVAADTINYEVTVDDPKTWTKPWTAVIPLKQVQAKIYESACHEGNQITMQSILAGARADEKARLR